MLDIRYIVENSEIVKKAMESRNGSFDIDGVVRLDQERKDVLKIVESQKAFRNTVSEEIAVLKKNSQDATDKIKSMKEVGEDIKRLDERLLQIENQIREKLEGMPNIPHCSVPLGKDESCNKEIKRVGNPVSFDFEAKPHWELGESLGILDAATAAKMTGARFMLYRGAGAKLERALINFMLDTHTASGYTELLTPFMVNRESMFGTGQLPKFEEDAFALRDTNYFMVPTAEVPVTNVHRGEIIALEQLPIRYCAYTPCFRAEAGSAGRDTRGLIRMHQFNKVELVQFVRPEISLEALESLTADAESILKKLELPYRVVCLCSGDMGFASAKTYDIEVWMPSYNRYMEISSCSNYSDFQARRMNIKYRNKEGKACFVHTLNGSGLAIGRTVAAIMENCQTTNGEIRVPKALIPYMGTDKISKLS